jgi:hypothetical protein
MNITIDNKTFLIGVLSVTATILFVANMGPTQTAKGELAIQGREYQAVTARVAQGGEGLYLVDNRTGLMAVFTYDTASRTIKNRLVRPITEAFGGAAAPNRGARSDRDR